MTVTFGRADHVEQIAVHTRDELRTLNDIVNGMHRQIQKLQSDVRTLRGDP